MTHTLRRPGRATVIWAIVIGAIAANISLAAVLTPEVAAQMTCAEVFSELRQRTELYQQLGEAYLQTHNTLADVYSSWGKRLTPATSSAEAAAVGEHFLKAAASNRSAVAQSQVTVETLKTETAILIERLGECIK